MASEPTKRALNCKIEKAHTNYYTKILDNSLNGNHRQFWKYIRTQYKDNHDISTLVVDGKPRTKLKCKAIALKAYFNSDFKKKT